MRNVAFRFDQSVPQVLTSAKLTLSPRRLIAGLLFCCSFAPGILADSITYQQLQQSRDGRAVTVAALPAVGRTDKRPDSDGRTGNIARESPSHPEFVRLPDGRIVLYGPGIICEENCVEPVVPAAFRGPGPALWWLAPPAVAGSALCAFLCGSESNGGTPQSTLNTINPTQLSPPVNQTAPPQQVPEPSTLVLVGLGLGAMLARHRKAKKAQD